MLKFVCKEDGMQHDWYYCSDREMFLRCDKDAKVHRLLAGKYLADPEAIRRNHKREPSKATQAMWDFWHKVKEGICLLPQPTSA